MTIVRTGGGISSCRLLWEVCARMARDADHISERPAVAISHKKVMLKKKSCSEGPNYDQGWVF